MQITAIVDDIAVQFVDTQAKELNLKSRSATVAYIIDRYMKTNGESCSAEQAAEILSLKTEVSIKTAVISQQEAEISRLRTDLQTGQAREAEAMEALGAMKAEHDPLAREKTRLLQEVQTITLSLEDARTSVQKLTTEGATLREKNAALEAQVQAITETLKKAESAAQEVQTQFRNMELEYMVMKGKLEAKMEENANLYAHINVEGRENQKIIEESESVKKSIVSRIKAALGFPSEDLGSDPSEQR